MNRMASAIADEDSFPQKLWNMVEDHNYEDIIWWNKVGDGFLICEDREKFLASKILEVYHFKHRNYSFSSFVRQLGYYGFHKRKNGKLTKAYHHDRGYFNKNQPELSKITKKRKKGAADSSVSSKADCFKEEDHGEHTQECIGKREQEVQFFGAAAHLNNASLLGSQQCTYAESGSMQLTPTAVIQQQIEASITPGANGSGRSDSGLSSEENLSLQDQVLEQQSTRPQQAVVIIHPNRGPVEGNAPFSLRFIKNNGICYSVQRLLVEFEWNTVEAVRKPNTNNTWLGETPASEKLGTVVVKIKTPDKNEVGRTLYTYYMDEDEDAMERVVNSTRLQWSCFNEFSEEQYTNQGSGQNSTASSSSLGFTKQGGKQQSVNVLKRLVYTAARIGAEEFIRMIFSTSAGRTLFGAFKTESLFPEDIADANGHDEIAAYLRAQTQRFCKENEASQTQSKDINWLELLRAVEESEVQSAGPAEKNNMVKELDEDGISEAVYFGYSEASSDSDKDRTEGPAETNNMVKELDEDGISEAVYFGDSEASSDSDKDRTEVMEEPISNAVHAEVTGNDSGCRKTVPDCKNEHSNAYTKGDGIEHPDYEGSVPEKMSFKNPETCLCSSERRKSAPEDVPERDRCKGISASFRGNDEQHPGRVSAGARNQSSSSEDEGGFNGRVYWTRKRKKHQKFVIRPNDLGTTKCESCVSQRSASDSTTIALDDSKSEKEIRACIVENLPKLMGKSFKFFVKTFQHGNILCPCSKDSKNPCRNTVHAVNPVAEWNGKNISKMTRGNKICYIHCQEDKFLMGADEAAEKHRIGILSEHLRVRRLLLDSRIALESASEEVVRSKRALFGPVKKNYGDLQRELKRMSEVTGRKWSFIFECGHPLRTPKFGLRLPEKIVSKPLAVDKPSHDEKVTRHTRPGAMPLRSRNPVNKSQVLVRRRLLGDKLAELN